MNESPTGNGWGEYKNLVIDRFETIDKRFAEILAELVVIRASVSSDISRLEKEMKVVDKESEKRIRECENSIITMKTNWKWIIFIFTTIVPLAISVVSNILLK